MKKVHSNSYLAGAVLCLLCLLGIIYYCFFASFSTCEDTQYIYIDQDDTTDSVYVKLKPYGNAGTLTAFSTLARMTGYGDNIRTGRYAIPANENIITLFRHIKNGRQEPIRLTIPESRTTDRLAGALSRKLMLDSTVVAILLRDSSFCAQQGYDTATIACLFVPNTYEVYWDITIENLMKRMKKEHDRFWEGERTTKAQALGLTPNEVCTVASIIDDCRYVSEPSEDWYAITGRSYREVRLTELCPEAHLSRYAGVRQSVQHLQEYRTAPRSHQGCLDSRYRCRVEQSGSSLSLYVCQGRLLGYAQFRHDLSGASEKCSPICQGT